MPAPTKEEIKSFIVAALTTDNALSGRTSFAKVVEGETFPGELPDAMEDFVDGISEGISRAWVEWQRKQTVVTTVAGVTVGAASVPGIGTPGQALP